MRFSTLALAALAVASPTLAASAATLNVPQRYSTIQAALNAAKTGDTVLVSPKANGAVYNEGVTIRTPGITLQGRNNPVLDGTGLVPGTLPVNGVNIQANRVAVRGLTVQNFNGTTWTPTFRMAYATGIISGLVDDNFNFTAGFSDVEVSDCKVQNNTEGVSVWGYDVNFNALPNIKVQSNAISNDSYAGVSAYGAGIQITSNTVATSSEGVSVSGNDLAITGNTISGCSFDGISADGDGLTITSNNISGGYIGVNISTSSFNPKVNNPASPNPHASSIALNSIHDNSYYGINAQGTMTISSNAVTHNTGYGIYLYYGDYSTVSLNAVTNTVPSQYAYPGFFNEAGEGIVAQYNQGGSITIATNFVGSNAGDGITLDSVDGSLVTGNLASCNSAVGIYVTDYTGGNTPNTLTLNIGQGNKLFDAQDDNLIAGGSGYARNLWTKNLFGKTNPVNLNH